MLLTFFPIQTVLPSLILSLSPLPTDVELQTPTKIPVLEIVKIYGTLADSECFGKVSPLGSSCQITPLSLKSKLNILPDASSPSPSISREEFRTALEKSQFAWPLKPYGISQSSSLSKTATVNKGAETYIYMDELESRHLYDRRNPTGPLPTSLRPKLNKLLKEEGIDENAINFVWGILSGGEGMKLTEDRIDEVLKIDGGNGEYMDYYSFLEFLGAENIRWPTPSL